MSQDILTAFMQRHQGHISASLSELFALKADDAKKLSPTLLHSIEVLEAFALQGGKRIRPMLVIVGYLLAGGQISDSAGATLPIYQVAAAIELVHKYLLVLDDIADQDELRNGQPTVWQRYETEFAAEKWSNVAHHGRTFAEIDSALLASLVTVQVMRGQSSEFLAEKLLAVLQLINQHMYFETVAGWQIQYKLNHVPLSEATETEFMKGLELVTAQYTFVAPLKIGASLGKQNSPQLQRTLEEYGMAVGTAFQLQDDILGLFGDPADTGKPVGNDVREGKKTLLLQKAYQKAGSVDQSFLSNICGRTFTSAELKRAQKIVKETGSLAYSQHLAKQFVSDGIAALSSLNSLDQQSEEVTILVELAKFVIGRSH